MPLVEETFPLTEMSVETLERLAAYISSHPVTIAKGAGYEVQDPNYPHVWGHLEESRVGQRVTKIAYPALGSTDVTATELLADLRNENPESFSVIVNAKGLYSLTLEVRRWVGGGSLRVAMIGEDQDVVARARILEVIEDIGHILAPTIRAEASVGDFTVFIGHGHGTDWHLIEEKIEAAGFRVLAFESEPRAGGVSINIVETIIRSSHAAVLHLTPDDRMSDGSARGRQNVVHEIGFAQGALGVDRVVVLQHSDVEKFSNMDGVNVVFYKTGEMYEKLKSVVIALEALKVRHHLRH